MPSQEKGRGVYIVGAPYFVERQRYTSGASGTSWSSAHDEDGAQ